MKAECMKCEWRTPFDGEGQQTKENHQIAYCRWEKKFYLSSVMFELCPANGFCMYGKEAEAKC